ncbi:hypothetical protein BDP27DRAFT_1496162 [Rhodocollybia butyracea]|uniref:Uncharacterized protein n=1 Tax=Rhodocollybia butyracea TaxID=206335 RepID=A0A9P5PAH8_9AGAR|nr:hypothetical protein BDP27DRAFT_1496162 [Rhodocollybia butyracea]
MERSEEEGKEGSEEGSKEESEEESEDKVRVDNEAWLDPEDGEGVHNNDNDLAIMMLAKDCGGINKHKRAGPEIPNEQAVRCGAATRHLRTVAESLSQSLRHFGDGVIVIESAVICEATYTNAIERTRGGWKWSRWSGGLSLGLKSWALQHGIREIWQTRIRLELDGCGNGIRGICQGFSSRKRQG